MTLSWGEAPPDAEKIEVTFTAMGTWPHCGSCKHYRTERVLVDVLAEDGDEVMVGFCGIYKTVKGDNDTCKRWSWNNR